LKRALRIDKVTMAALAAVLRLYLDPARLRERLPTLRLLTRPADEIRAGAQRVQPHLAMRLAGWAEVALIECASEIGSGAQPLEKLPSAGLAITPSARRGRGSALNHLARALRALPMPVIGRIEDDRLVLDFRCAEDEAALLNQLVHLAPPT
jgi:L-seryl-tRNA(Ser) seleniumtransferase